MTVLVVSVTATHVTSPLPAPSHLDKISRSPVIRQRMEPSHIISDAAFECAAAAAAAVIAAGTATRLTAATAAFIVAAFIQPWTLKSIKKL